MKKYHFLAFLKHVYNKTSWQLKVQIFYFSIGIVSFIKLILLSKPSEYSKNAMTGIALFFILTGLNALIIITGTILYYYRNFKKNIYLKTKLPKNTKIFQYKKPIENEDNFDIRLYLERLETRIESLEKATPLKMTLYAIFVGIALGMVAILISVLSKFIF